MVEFTIVVVPLAFIPPPPPVALFPLMVEFTIVVVPLAFIPPP
jgi:hypothetical protein